MGLIKEILATCDDIVAHYEQSKAPKFIKQIIAKNNFNRVNKVIAKLNDQITIEQTSEYIEVLLEHLPPKGQYKHCKSVIGSNGRFAAKFEFDMLKNKNGYYIVVADIFQVPNGGFDNQCLVQISIFHNDLRIIGTKKYRVLSFRCNLNDLIPMYMEDSSEIEKLGLTARKELRNIVHSDTIEFLVDYTKESKGKISI